MKKPPYEAPCDTYLTAIKLLSDFAVEIFHSSFSVLRT